MAEEISAPQRSAEEHKAEINALSWTFSTGSPENIQKLLEMLLWTPVPRLQQIDLKKLINMGKSSPHTSQEMERSIEIISKRVGMFSVFASGKNDTMSSLIRGLSALGGKGLDTYGILEFLAIAQTNNEASKEIIKDLEELAKKVLIYYWKIFSRDDIDEMQRFIRRLKLSSQGFLNAIRIWSLYDAALKNPQAPQTIKKDLEALRNKEKAVREKQGSAKAKKRAQEDFKALLLKKPKSRRGGAGFRSLQGPDKQKLQKEFDELEQKNSSFKELEQQIQSVMEECSTTISNCCDKIQDEHKSKLAQKIIKFSEYYIELLGNPMATLQKEKVKGVIINYSTQTASINGINSFTELIVQLDEYNRKKKTNNSNEKRKEEIEHVLI